MSYGTSHEPFLMRRLLVARLMIFSTAVPRGSHHACQQRKILVFRLMSWTLVFSVRVRSTKKVKFVCNQPCLAYERTLQQRTQACLVSKNLLELVREQEIARVRHGRREPGALGELSHTRVLVIYSHDLSIFSRSELPCCALP